MSLTKTEETLVIWGGASMILVMVTILSYFSYRKFLPKTVEKNKILKMEDVVELSSRENSRKTKVLEVQRKIDNDNKVIPLANEDGS